MPKPQQLDQIDDLLGVTARLAAWREKRHVLAPFTGYSRPDKDRDAFDKIERALEHQARSLARGIAAELPR